MPPVAQKNRSFCSAQDDKDGTGCRFPCHCEEAKPTRQSPGTTHRTAPQKQTSYREIAAALMGLAMTGKVGVGRHGSCRPTVRCYRRGEHCSSGHFVIKCHRRRRLCVIFLRKIRKCSIFGGRPMAAPTLTVFAKPQPAALPCVAIVGGRLLSVLCRRKYCNFPRQVV